MKMMMKKKTKMKRRGGGVRGGGRGREGDFIFLASAFDYGVVLSSPSHLHTGQFTVDVLIVAVVARRHCLLLWGWRPVTIEQQSVIYRCLCCCSGVDICGTSLHTHCSIDIGCCKKFITFSLRWGALLKFFLYPGGEWCFGFCKRLCYVWMLQIFSLLTGCRGSTAWFFKYKPFL